jgi:hypothetical protein
MVSQYLKADLHNNKNKTFLRRLYRINEHTPKTYKRKLINNSTKKQRQVLMSVLNLVLTKVIPLKQAHIGSVTGSRSFKFLQRNFRDKAGYKRLQQATVKEQRCTLLKVNLYHELLANLFKR